MASPFSSMAHKVELSVSELILFEFGPGVRAEDIEGLKEVSYIDIGLKCSDFMLTWDACSLGCCSDMLHVAIQIQPVYSGH